MSGVAAERGNLRTMNSAASHLATIYEAERSALERFLRARCGEDSEAEDIMQDLWLKLSALDTGPIENPRAYLFRIANNLALDRRRSRQRAMQRDRGWLAEDGELQSPELRPDPAQPVDEAIVQQQEARVLRQAIEALPPGARRALQLYRVEGHNQGEIAVIMGISRSGVEKHLALAMKNLRNALCDCGAFAPVTSSRQEPGSGGTTLEDSGQ